MTDFLLNLGKLNLAMGGAILLVWLLRRPVRTQFGAPIAYALWLLVPIAGLASLAPPRVAPPLPAHVMAVQIPAAPVFAKPQIAPLAPLVTEQLPRQSAPTDSARPVQPIIAPRAAIRNYAMPDYASLLFAAWLLGVGVMTLYLARLQARFHAAARLGEAGPAVVGFLRPRIVIPDGFVEQFTAPEQAAILAHERVHLARQDARINALAALLRALCWFNPLMHLGASWLRIDQELACDAAAVAAQVSRRDYANALLKSQITATALPLGCDWPGSEHPLTERIALLKRKPLGPARRIAGTGLVLFAAGFAGLSAWAAQPAVPAKAVVAPHDQIALATAMPAQIAAPVANSNPVAVSNPAPVMKPIPAPPPVISSNPVAVARPVPVAKLVSATPPAEAQAPNTDLALNAPSPAITGTSDTGSAKGTVSSVSPLQALSNDGCQPVIGTLTSVHGDPGRAGLTDVVLDDVLPAATVHDRQFIVYIYIGNMSDFPALDTYVGRKIAVWPSTTKVSGLVQGPSYPNGIVNQINRPLQLEPLSTALADPKKTWCYIPEAQRARILADRLYQPPGQDGATEHEANLARNAPAVTATGNTATTILPKVTQPLQQAQLAAEEVPDQTVAAVTSARAKSDQVSKAPDPEGCLPFPLPPMPTFGSGAPPVIGILASVHADPTHFGTDVVLDHILPTPQGTAVIRDGSIVAFIPADSGTFTVSGRSLDAVIGQKVAMWTAGFGFRLLPQAVRMNLLCDASQVRRETGLLPNDASAPGTKSNAQSAAPAAAPAKAAADISAAAASQPLAGQIPADGMTAKDVSAWLHAAGYEAPGPGHGIGADGKPYMRVYSHSSYHDLDLAFFINLFDCNGERCRVLQFYTALPMLDSKSRRFVSHGMVDRWNNANPSIKARFSGIGRTSTLNFDLQLPPTYEQLNNELALWNDSLDRFYDFVKMGTSPAAAIRPEITQRLQSAAWLSDHSGSYLGAQNQISEAEAVPNQSDAERQAVAQTKARIMGTNNPFGLFNLPNNNRPTIPASSYLPRGDVGRNNPD